METAIVYEGYIRRMENGNYYSSFLGLYNGKENEYDCLGFR